MKFQKVKVLRKYFQSTFVIRNKSKQNYITSNVSIIVTTKEQIKMDSMDTTLTNTRLPKLKSRTLTERVNLSVTPETKSKLDKLKNQGIDHQEWIRQLIDKGFQELEVNYGYVTND